MIISIIPIGLLMVLSLVFFVIALTDAKSQFNNPYKFSHSYTEFTNINRLQMLCYIASLAVLIVSLFFPVYKVGGELFGKELKMEGVRLTDLSDLPDGTVVLIVMIVSIIACIIMLRLTRMAHYFSLFFYIVAGAYMIYKLNEIISQNRKEISISGTGVASGGYYYGVGFYLLAISLVIAVLAVAMILFKERDNKI